MENKKVILAVGAHPDDMDFGASGTVAEWVKEGAEAYYLIVTDGSKGSDDPKMTEEQLVKIRRQEQKKAGEILGLKKVFFLDYKDTELTVTQRLKEDIVRIIRQVKPTIVITMDPAFYYSSSMGFVNHSDHRAVGIAVMDAVYPLARDRLTFPSLAAEGLRPWKTKELMFVSFSDQPELVVDISKTIDKKMQALKAHTSQVGDIVAVEDRLRERGKLLGKQYGYEFAEGFTKLVLPS